MKKIEPTKDKAISACKLLYKQHPKLYDFLIHPQTQSLRQDPEKLIENIGAFSSGEQVLIHVGLDLCFNVSQSKLWDVVNRLDSNNFQNVLNSISYLRTKRI